MFMIVGIHACFCVAVRVCLCGHSYIHTYVHTYIYTHTYIHTSIHTHKTHTHTHVEAHIGFAAKLRGNKPELR